MRSMRRDRSVTQRKLAKGTTRRVLRFAAPYRLQLISFLFLIVLDAIIAVATPVLAGRVVNTITSRGEVRTVVVIAAIIAVLAVFDAGLSFAQRWYSARIGEGLIFDLRTAVFDHVQQMPLAFFTRTQTGALVSRLNGDVLGAQQAFTSTLSGVVSNAVSLVITAAVMFSLSWQITALSLVMLPVFVVPARRIGTRLQEDHPRVLQPRRLHERHHDRALQRVGCVAGQAVRTTDRGGRLLPGPRRTGARHRRHFRHVRTGVLRRTVPRGQPGAGVGVRTRRLLRAERHVEHGHRGDACPVVDASLRSAHGSIQRTCGRHERTGELRPGVRDLGPEAHGGRRAGCRRTTRDRAQHRVRRRAVLLSAGRRGLAGVTGGRGQAGERRLPGGAAWGELPRRSGGADRVGRPIRRG